MIVELTLKNGKKVKFEKFGEINFGQGIKTVNDLTTKEKIKLENMYRQLVAQTQRELVRLKLKGNKATVTDELRKLQLNDLKNSLDKNLWEITQSTQSAIQNGMLQASQAVARDMTKWLNSLGINVKTSFSYVPQDVVSNIVSGRLYGADWNFSSRIWGDYNKSVSDITKIVAQGIAENKPTYDIAKDLEKYVNPNAVKPWDWSKVYPNSKKKIDYNAQRLARTMINHAYQQSIVETCKSNPFVKGIQWRSAFSKTTCPICESLNGNIFPVGEIPLDHPNGKCTFIAVIDKSSQEIENDLLKWVDGEADDEFNQKMELFAEKAGFTKADIDIKQLKNISKRTKPIKKDESEIRQKPSDKMQEWVADNCITKEMADKLGISVRDRNTIINVLSNQSVSEKYRQAFLKARQHIKEFSIETKDISSNYSPYSQALHLTKVYKRNKMENPHSPLFHEFGHAIDDLALDYTHASTFSSSSKFTKALFKDLDALKKNLANGKVTKQELLMLRQDDNSNGVQDILGAAKYLDSRYEEISSIRYKWGHSDDYWQNGPIEYIMSSELFAHMSSANVSQKESEYMDKYFPNFKMEYQKIIELIANKNIK